MRSSKDLSPAYRMFFSTLATESRLRIINALRQSPKNVTQLCRATGFEQSMLSHNLKLLEHHGMVFPERKGKFRYYRVNKKTIKPLLELIDAHMKQYCCKILEGLR